LEYFAGWQRWRPTVWQTLAYHIYRSSWERNSTNELHILLSSKYEILITVRVKYWINIQPGSYSCNGILFMFLSWQEGQSCLRFYLALRSARRLLFSLLSLSETTNNRPPLGSLTAMTGRHAVLTSVSALALYRGADKSLARPDWKKLLKGRHFSSDAQVIAAAETWSDGQSSEFFWVACKSMVAVACFLLGRAKDLSAPR